ncbi:zf-HC2 domain-containing protein [uncultured Desulfosarcina sp.]|uniref:anti-sigma factor family protein n=1 Tax=uncultured Desulfosarcina sp. TaxID=218289 RepID=UPI0029C658D0|nr:zf-HC2 domain-containing protein [uncultured Desulfosarcina sp.]
MTNVQSNVCDDALLVRYLDGDLDPDEKNRMAAHLQYCETCRRQLAFYSDFSQDFKRVVEQETEQVDFTPLEKEVINKALYQHLYKRGPSSFLSSLKFVVPAAATACLLLFFAYTHLPVDPGPTAPSAVIKSFTGSMTSVMIFETPETRQTILWYHEEPDTESDNHAS